MEEREGWQLVAVRPVWQRACQGDDGETGGSQGGWFAGFAFLSVQAGSEHTGIPENLRVDVPVTIDYLDEMSSFHPAAGEAVSAGELSLSGETIDHLRVAAESLLPTLAQYIADVRMMVTQGRLEISANFRSRAELNTLQRPGAPRRSIGTSHGTPIQRSSEVDPSAGPRQFTGAFHHVGGKRILVAAAGLVAVMLGWNAGRSVIQRDEVATAPTILARPSVVPAWAADLEPTSREGWLRIQAHFRLPDGTLRSMIQLFKANDDFPSGHSLYDLTLYPTQIQRAFRILVGSGEQVPRDLLRIDKDLQMRLVSGKRFPDEPPGDRHSALSRELQDNETVMIIVRLLHRRQNDPVVRELLTALRGQHAQGL